jgi:hypothetical protein
LGREFALLGGLAVSAWVDPRTTKDVDLAVVVDGDDDAEQLAFELSQRGYSVDATIEHTGTGRLATIRMTSLAGAIGALFRAATDDDFRAAREALQLIADRGYGRDRALLEELDRAVDELGT